jgi:hypothetical protein
LAVEVVLVADDVVQAGGLGEDAFAAKVLELASEPFVGDALLVELAIGGPEGLGLELLGVAAGLVGDGLDEAEKSIDGPVLAV